MGGLRSTAGDHNAGYEQIADQSECSERVWPILHVDHPPNHLTLIKQGNEMQHHKWRTQTRSDPNACVFDNYDGHLHID